MKILISGVCGFVGGHLAGYLMESHKGISIVGLDNLVRSGSETNRVSLKRLGVQLFHGDIRMASDLETLPLADWVVDAAAQPSVLFYCAAADLANSSTCPAAKRTPLCRFMNSLAKVRPEANLLPPGLQLPGGFVRLHIVERKANPLLWELLGLFGEHELAPILVNTSFNLPPEPPVVRPRDAIRTFFCSGIDAVFIDNFLLTKWSSAYVLNGYSVQKPEIQDTVRGTDS
jgi:hypothetical protein